MKNNLLDSVHLISASDLDTAKATKKDKYSLTPKAVAKFLLLIILLLFIAHVVALTLNFTIPESNRVVILLDKYFNFNNEANFPSFISAINLLAAAGLIFYIRRISENTASRNNKRFWFVLGCIFVFLCFDEATQIHEEIILTIRSRVPDLPGFLYYAWVIPYSVLFLGVVVYCFRFVLALPVKTRNLFFLAGFLFVSGAIGCELIEGYIEKFYGRNLVYNLFTTIEESLEMVSIVIFIYALLDYITLQKSKLTLKFKSKS
ncbi:multidrug transporter [Adhaeribacter rhizoryzae]|uniref:Multidrug transporter n=1 Tax=Adhaeribacter rhizoryzae TaxID=2607907 RepID=A0A5M6DMP4_9BACT|nr:multidrug transporter [Adhaeribacter rhizoryzae]KAA5548791.1 multidrug transporter [Adhaeribacter rhizoryzae]